MNRHPFQLVSVFLLALLSVVLAIPTGCAAVADALPVVSAVAGIARQVCEAGDDPLACLKKCEERAQQCPCGVDGNGDCEPCPPPPDCPCGVDSNGDCDPCAAALFEHREPPP